MYKKLSTRLTPLVFGFLAALSLPGCLCKGPETVPYVDIGRYMGKWYEIAKYPVFFERGLVGVTAEYSLRDDGAVRVVNQGYRGSFDGDVSRIEGKATVADRETNAKLTVQFGPFPVAIFGSNYWIVKLGDNYEYAIVSSRCRNTLWILSRTPTMDETLYDELVDWIAEAGFDPDRLERMPQAAE